MRLDIAGLERKQSRRWEQGDDISMTDFRCAEYSEGKMVADEETRRQLVEIGIRKTARETGIHSDTVTLIARREPVKPITLAKIVSFIAQRSDD